MSAYCRRTPDRRLAPSRRNALLQTLRVLTDLLLGLLVRVAGLDAVLGRLGLGDGPLDSDKPSVALGSRLGLERVLVARDLESKGNGAVLGEVGCISLSHVRGCRLSKSSVCAYQVQDASRVLLLVCVLDEEEKTLSGLARPRSDRVGNLGLLAAEVLAQVLGRDGLLAEPEVLLGEAEGTEMAD